MELTICSLSDKILIYVFNQSTYYCQTELSGKSWYWLTNYVNKLKVRTNVNFHSSHCLKSVCFRSFTAPYFRAFGLNTERYFISLCIQSECGENTNQKNSEYRHILSSVNGKIITNSNQKCRICILFFPQFCRWHFLFSVPISDSITLDIQNLQLKNYKCWFYEVFCFNSIHMIWLKLT